MIKISEKMQFTESREADIIDRVNETTLLTRSGSEVCVRAELTWFALSVVNTETLRHQAMQDAIEAAHRQLYGDIRDDMCSLQRSLRQLGNMHPFASCAVYSNAVKECDALIAKLSEK